MANSAGDTGGRQAPSSLQGALSLHVSSGLINHTSQGLHFQVSVLPVEQPRTVPRTLRQRTRVTVLDSEGHAVCVARSHLRPLGAKAAVANTQMNEHG